MYRLPRKGFRLPALILPVAMALLVSGMMTVHAAGRVSAGPEQAVGLPHPLARLKPGGAIAPDSQVAGLLSEVEVAALRKYERWLTGEAPVTVGGQPTTIGTRYTYSGEPIQKATQFAYERLDALGLEVDYHQWAGATYPNVIASKEGLTRPEEVYILSAHLDSLPAGPVAPGADDNASGSAGVLVAAEILSEVDLGCTLIFALWTGEEQGMLGSNAWAEWATGEGLDIRGVLNMDMIAYDSVEAPVVDLHARSTVTGSVEMAGLFANAVDAYELDLDLDLLVDDSLGNRSDNRSFWDEGYPAILVIEDDADFNPNYHTPEDRLSALNLSYMGEVLKASLATLIHSRGCLISQGVGRLEGQVLTGGQPVTQAAVAMVDGQGEVFMAHTDSGGTYGRVLPAGTYEVTVTAEGYRPETVVGLAVLAESATAQNFELQRTEELGWRLYLPQVLDRHRETAHREP